MQVTRIIAVRHGETAWNRDTRIQGHTDIALNATGQWQARQLARALAQEPLAAIYSSDLQRAQATAQAVAEATGAPLHLDAGLRERGFSAFEGRSFAEIETQLPEQARRWRQREPDYAPEGGETLLQLRARVHAATEGIAARHPGALLLLVAHGGVLDMLYRAATRQSIQAPRTWQLTNTAINRLLWTPGHGLSLVGWADTGHLEQASRDETTA